MKISIIFLGTGSAIPTEKRNHHSIILRYKDENILIDCGEGTQRQFRKAHLNPCKLTRLLITHWHGDHVLGIPGLFETLAQNNYKKTLFIYGPKGTKKYIQKIFKIFIHTKPIKMNIQEVKGKFLETKDFKITSFPLEHGPPCNGYSFEEKNKLRINKEKLKKLKLPNIPEISKLIHGRNIKINNQIIKAKNLTYLQKGKKISFIFDTKLCSNLNRLSKNSDLSIMDSTYSKEHKELASEYKHLTSTQAAEIAKKQKVKQLVLTHISQRYENKEHILLNEAKKIFPNTILAQDFMKLEI